MKLTFREKYSYGMGAFGKDLVYAFVATYLMMFFTDEVGISSVFVGGLFFVSRFWDAINDPIMGRLVDNTNTKWGKFRPWILIGTLINAVVLIFLFVNPTKFLSGKMVYVYCSVAYILWGMTYTIMDIPYWSMIPSFTSDAKERDKMSVIPRIFATIGGSTVNTFGLMLIGVLGVGSNSLGYFRLGLGISIVFVISTIITVCNVKEVNTVKNQEKISLKEVFEILFKNDQLLVIIASVIIYQVALFLVAGFALYFFKYAIQNEGLYAIFTGLSTVVQVCALMIFPKLVSKLSRKIVYILACVLPIIGFVSMFFISSITTNIVLLCIAGGIYNLGFAFSSASTTVMLCDAVDYGEYKVGKRSESIVFSMQTFIVKFSTAFSGLIVGIGLNLINYVPNATQTAETILGMKIIMFVIPSILMMACLVVYLKYYKLNGEYKENILREIERRRNGQSIGKQAI
ncbi:melibiose:sodium transporter MelB [Clostridium sp.]|uniref:melibiose:sodium transporter MelB n=1 Tax=Clostridium sp. TaxID=1506 RepID=UPI003F3ED893